jgi:hypothetical protein
LAYKAHRVVQGLTWGCAILLGAALISSCAPPQYTYVTDSADSAYFKVPHYWHQVSQTGLCTELEKDSGSSSCPTNWSIAYQAVKEPSANSFLAFNVSEPFVFSEVEPYTSTTDTPLTDSTLEDFFLPVSATARETDAAEGFPLTDFQQLQDSNVTLSGGYHGVREVFNYTYPGEAADTFDEVILTNSAGSTIYFLVTHCTTSCYSHDQAAINSVMSSFTVRSH